MKLNPRYKYVAIIGYLVFLVAGILYVHSVISSGKVQVSTQSTPKKVPKVRFIDVSLQIENGPTYRIKLTNFDTVLDLLDEARQHNGFRYELVEYTDGTQIDSINGISSTAARKWRVFVGEKDVTSNMGDVVLENDKTYTIRSVAQQ
ncbi:MAG TPA: hypothetical protein VLI92_00625 [Candidatus Saccharimonadales bacterium]|nr:hypothetical protein [Candidatus Saccharimonadales bacterium]